MRMPICNVLSLALPAVVGAVGYDLMRKAKSATNFGEALAPLYILAFALTAAAVLGEVLAIISLARGERLAWLSWLGALVNGVLLLPAAYLLLTA